MLSLTGGIDRTFVTSGANATINDVLYDSSGKYILAGNFTTFGATTVNRIIRVTSTGGIDNTFYPGSGANVAIKSVAEQSDGKYIVGGDFTTFTAS